MLRSLTKNQWLRQQKHTGKLLIVPSRCVTSVNNNKLVNELASLVLILVSFYPLSKCRDDMPAIFPSQL